MIEVGLSVPLAQMLLVPYGINPHGLPARLCWTAPSPDRIGYWERPLGGRGSPGSLRAATSCSR
jgi:hypothetical protein